MPHVVCVIDDDKITYAVFGPFDTLQEAETWAEAMEYDKFDVHELREPEEIETEE